ncbi:MAG: hypothetical protein J5J00_11535 [Deltaproteobacteria bacterium]|nr:hypothetical protein [Deltaproteobacteria bacterium]
MEKILAITLATFKESIRSKVLYSVMFFAAVLVLVSTFFGTVTIGDQVKVIKDFGLFSVSIFSIAFAVISGTTLLFKELQRKTIYNILSKSVYRWQFLLGKYFGMLLTASTLVVSMGLSLLAYLWFFEGGPDFLILSAMFFMVLELVIVCAAAMLFSSIVVTPLLSGLFTFATFLAGRSTEYLLYFVQYKEVDGLAADLLVALNKLLPNLDKLNVVNEVVYGEAYALPVERMLWSSVYALCYAGVLLIAANMIFRRREFN